jgi:hypothetical protein
LSSTSAVLGVCLVKICSNTCWPRHDTLIVTAAETGNVCSLRLIGGPRRLGQSEPTDLEYPPFGTYDKCRESKAEHKQAVTAIPKVGRPGKDPVYGLKARWLIFEKAG